MKKRIAWHIGFWLVFSMLYAMLTMGFSNTLLIGDYTPITRFFYFWAAEIAMLPAKMMATYGFLYILIPRFLRSGRYLKLAFYCLLWVVPLLLIHRVFVYYLVYPIIYDIIPKSSFFKVDRIVYSFVDLSLAVAVASTVKLLRGRLNSQRREEELLREKLQSELNFLRSQTNPHFLFNTLNNIYALARKQSKNTAPVVMKLSQIMRFMLYECTSPRIYLADEIKVIRDYIELEKLRYNDRLSITFSEEIDDSTKMVAPLLLLPFVENAFKHGISETRFNAFIEIILSLQKGILNISIKNSKDEEKSDNPSGIGLKNVKRQLELIYPDNHQLAIQNDEDRYSVQLNIDLNQDL